MKKLMKRSLAVMLALIMSVSMLNLTAFAAPWDRDYVTETVYGGQSVKGYWDGDYFYSIYGKEYYRHPTIGLVAASDTRTWHKVENMRLVRTDTATCTTPGYAYYTCYYPGCGEEEYVWVKALGHNMVPNTGTPATCFAPATSGGTHCTRCDHTEGELTTTGTRLDPVWGSTCVVENGVHYKVCTACNGGADGHKELAGTRTETSGTQTCQTFVTTTTKCANCGAPLSTSEGATLAANLPDAWTKLDDTQHVKECTNDGCLHTTAGHRVTETHTKGTFGTGTRAPAQTDGTYVGLDGDNFTFNSATHYLLVHTAPCTANCGMTYTAYSQIEKGSQQINVEYVLENGTKVGDGTGTSVREGGTVNVKADQVPNGYELVTPADATAGKDVHYTGRDPQTVQFVVKARNYKLNATYTGLADSVSNKPANIINRDTAYGTALNAAALAPDFDGYNKTVTVTGATGNQIPGTMPANDLTIAVVYTARPHTLTVNYTGLGTLPAGAVEPEDYTSTVPFGTGINVPAPDINGYTKTVSQHPATMPDNDVEVTVTYTAIQYTWNVNYAFANDEATAAADKTGVTLPGNTSETFTINTIGALNAKTVNNAGIFKPSADSVAVPTPTWTEGADARTITNNVYFSVMDSKNVQYQFVDENGEVVAGPTDTGDVVYEGGSVNVPVPGTLPDGYELVEGQGDETATFDEPLVSFEVQRRVYTLTINYLGAGTRAPYTAQVRFGDGYSQVSPVIAGYHLVDAAQATVAGTMPARDVTVDVLYAADATDTFSLYVRYVYEDGTTAATSYYNVMSEGDTYNVASPAIEGYTPDQAAVSGTMGTGNVSYTVTYTADEVEIEEPDTPQGNLPDEPEQPEVPEEPEQPEEPIEVEEPETPLGPLPELPEEIEVEDPDVPLANVPQTGDNTALWVSAAAASGIGLVWLAVDGRKRREDAE